MMQVVEMLARILPSLRTIDITNQDCVAFICRFKNWAYIKISGWYVW
jgi:hypothetical protein